MRPEFFGGNENYEPETLNGPLIESVIVICSNKPGLLLTRCELSFWLTFTDDTSGFWHRKLGME